MIIICYLTVLKIYSCLHCTKPHLRYWVMGHKTIIIMIQFTTYRVC